MSILIRVQALRGYPELVRQLQGEPGPLLARHGLSQVQLGDPRAYMAYHAFLALLEETARELDEPEFGLKLSQCQDLGMMGLIGLFLQQSRDLRSFFAAARSTIHSHNEGEDWELKIEGQWASVRRYERIKAVASNRQGRELAIGAVLRVIRQLIGDSWKPAWVSFIHGPAVPVASYKKCLQAEVQFNQEFDGLVFDVSNLDRSLTGSSEQVRLLLDQNLSELQLKYHEDFPEQVRTLIRHSIDHDSCKLENIARLLALSPRTLQRRLGEQGLAFRHLLNEVRTELACTFLKETDQPLNQLSLRLGYTEASAFTRAFRQQMGMAPLAWRSEHRPRCVKH